MMMLAKTCIIGGTMDGYSHLSIVACLDHLGHLGDVSCCKATMSRQENDAVALEVAHECRGAKRSSFCR